MKLKSLTKAIAIVSLSTLMTGCFGLSTTAKQGEALVFVKKPLMFGFSGVSDDVKMTGTWFHLWTTSGIPVSITPYQKIEVFNDLATSNKTPIDFDAPIQFVVNPENVWMIIDKYQSVTKWYKLKIKQIYREEVRNYARGKTSDNLMYDASELKLMGEAVRAKVQAVIDEDKFADVTVVRVLIGKANPPKALADEIAETSRQTQRKKTEHQKMLAEKTRKTAERERALADKAYQSEMGMTTEQYLRSRQIENQSLQVQNVTLAIKEGKNVNFMIGDVRIQPVKVMN